MFTFPYAKGEKNQIYFGCSLASVIPTGDEMPSASSVVGSEAVREVYTPLLVNNYDPIKIEFQKHLDLALSGVFRGRNVWMWVALPTSTPAYPEYLSYSDEYLLKKLMTDATYGWNKTAIAFNGGNYELYIKKRKITNTNYFFYTSTT